MLDAAEHRVATQRTVMGSGHLVSSCFRCHTYLVTFSLVRQVSQLKPDALGDAMHEILGLIGARKKSLL